MIGLIGKVFIDIERGFRKALLSLILFKSLVKKINRNKIVKVSAEGKTLLNNKLIF